MDNGLTCQCTNSALAESVRAKVAKFLSSGTVLTLAILLTLGAVMCGFAAISMLILTGLAIFGAGDLLPSGLISVLIMIISYIVSTAVYAYGAAALYRIRASARRGDCDGAASRLLSLRKCVSFFRVYYYINVGFSFLISPWSVYSANNLSDTGAQLNQAYLIGYVVGVVVFTALYVTACAVWNHIYCSALIKFTDNVRERLGDPISEKPKKCTLAAVMNFIGSGAVISLFAVVMFMVAVLALILAIAGWAAFSTELGSEGGVLLAVICAAVFLTFIFVYVGTMFIMLVPMIAYYTLVGAAALKYNKLEKEIAGLICENKTKDTAVTDGAPTE